MCEEVKGDVWRGDRGMCGGVTGMCGGVTGDVRRGKEECVEG